MRFSSNPPAVSVLSRTDSIMPVNRKGAHTFRCSYARHSLMSGVGVNDVSLCRGHASIKPTLMYLELVPDPAGSLEAVP